ncbi:hypothetical protein HDU97_004891 [Phlyctochytrium planicorne]|nr:hypothetical protein HDU97_004891 [Phlyctochytrium planicorne]
MPITAPIPDTDLHLDVHPKDHPTFWEPTSPTHLQTPITKLAQINGTLASKYHSTISSIESYTASITDLHNTINLTNGTIQMKLRETQKIHATIHEWNNNDSLHTQPQPDPHRPRRLLQKAKDHTQTLQKAVPQIQSSIRRLFADISEIVEGERPRQGFFGHFSPYEPLGVLERLCRRAEKVLRDERGRVGLRVDEFVRMEMMEFEDVLEVVEEGVEEEGEVEESEMEDDCCDATGPSQPAPGIETVTEPTELEPAITIINPATSVVDLTTTETNQDNSQGGHDTAVPSDAMSICIADPHPREEAKKSTRGRKRKLPVVKRANPRRLVKSQAETVSTTIPIATTSLSTSTPTYAQSMIEVPPRTTTQTSFPNTLTPSGTPLGTPATTNSSNSAITLTVPVSTTVRSKFTLTTVTATTEEDGPVPTHIV